MTPRRCPHCVTTERKQSALCGALGAFMFGAAVLPAVPAWIHWPGVGLFGLAGGILGWYVEVR